jgi:hypothetical protein
MVRLCLLIAFAVLPFAAQADERDQKKCILAAAEKLPTIPGLTITGSRAEPAQKSGYVVTIDFDAAKQSYSAKFDCLINGPGAVAKMQGLPD